MIPPEATRHGVPSGVLLLSAAGRATTMRHRTGGGGMYQKPLLSLDQTRRAMDAMLDKATQEPNRPVAIAIVDDAGNLLSYGRMDHCRPNPQTFAVRKAYTSAMSGQDSVAYAERLKSHEQRIQSRRGIPRSVVFSMWR